MDLQSLIVAELLKQKQPKGPEPVLSDEELQALSDTFEVGQKRIAQKDRLTRALGSQEADWQKFQDRLDARGVPSPFGTIMVKQSPIRQLLSAGEFGASMYGAKRAEGESERLLKALVEAKLRTEKLNQKRTEDYNRSIGPYGGPTPVSPEEFLDFSGWEENR